MVEAALFGRLGLQVYDHGLSVFNCRRPPARIRPFRKAADDHAILGDDDHLAIVQREHLPRIRKDGRYIRSQEVVALAQTDDKGTLLAIGHNLAGLVPVDHCQGHGAFQFLHGLRNCRRQITPVLILDKMGNYFGVNLRTYDMTARDELFSELTVVLNDAVMHENDVAHTIAMRMRVEIAGWSVSSPTRMPYRLTSMGQGFHQWTEVRQTPLALHGRDPRGIQNRYPRRIVSPVFQPAQSVKYDARCLFSSYVTYNAAHCRVLLSYMVPTTNRNESRCEVP